VRPGLDREVGLGVEADAEDDDGEEGSDVTGKLPVLPLPRLPRRRRRAVEEVPLGPILVPRRRPPPRALAAAAAAAAHAGGGAEPRAQHAPHGRRDRPHRCRRWSASASPARLGNGGCAVGTGETGQERKGWTGLDWAGLHLELQDVGCRSESGCSRLIRNGLPIAFSDFRTVFIEN
jgi:hypothetical protein